MRIKLPNQRLVSTLISVVIYRIGAQPIILTNQMTYKNLDTSLFQHENNSIPIHYAHMITINGCNTLLVLVFLMI